MPQKAILCVDDEPIILNSLKAQLKDYFGKQYMYEYAESAEEAWEVIEELHGNGVRILVIVSDWLMPRIKGDEFLIQVHQKFPDITKVMLTGHATAEAIERACQQAHLHRCIHKPWNASELIEAITSGLEDL
jgi:CheY-like chemotaxis protein